MLHTLKIKDYHFRDIRSLEKKFEIRKNDKGFENNHILLLCDLNSEHGYYIGNQVYVFVDYFLSNIDGVDKDYI